MSGDLVLGQISQRKVIKGLSGYGVVTLPTRHGPLAVLADDNPISAALSRYGEWAQIEIEFLQQFLPSSETIVDAGSHIGVHACAFADFVPHVTVHAFEPQPILRSLLMHNTLSHDHRIVVHDSALGAEAAIGYVADITPGVAANAGAMAVQQSPTAGGIRVPVRALDDLGLRDVGFIKLDTEGSESKILLGARELLARDRPVVFCEVNTVADAAALLHTMADHDYVAYFVATAAFNPQNFACSADNLFGHAHESAIVFVPVGRTAPQPMRATTVERVQTLDEVAALLLRMPRYGDSTAHDRDPAFLHRQLCQVQAERDDSARALSTERHQAQESLEAVRELSSARQKMLQELDVTRERADAAEKELRKAHHEITRSQAEASEAKNRVIELQGARQKMLQELDATRDRADATEKELLEAHRGIAKAQTEISEVKYRLHDLYRTHDARRVEHAQTKSLLDSLEERMKVLQQTLDIEYRRRAVILELVESAALPIAQRNWFGGVMRRISTGSLGKAIQQLQSSGFFDEAWYQSENSGAVKRLHPAVHYLLSGGYSGLNPGPDFDNEAYLEANSDVRLNGVNPLLHYAVWGRREMRQLRPLPASTAEPVPQMVRCTRPIAPPLSQFISKREAWSGHARAPGTPIDVIIPVYRGYDDTLACIASVLSNPNSTPFEVVVVDDCSPEPELAMALRLLADIGLITLLRNEANLGFVGTVNRGMSLHADRDVVLLNSDTLVYNNWLDRIMAHASAHPKVATVTPFTNNGTICSYPKFCDDNPEMFGPSLEACDRVLATVNHGKSVEVPTGVGFCMYISRSALTAAGLFDAETFGKGYGEENDFCMRANQAGWKNLHALDIFVFHSGETSFGASAAAGKKQALEAMQRKHPGYLAKVESFIRCDPARGARMAADAAQLRRRGTTVTTVCISHRLGGGIERYLKDLDTESVASGRDVLVLTPAVPGGVKARLHRVGAAWVLPNLAEIDLRDIKNTVAPLLAALGADRLEVHSTVGWSRSIPEVIQRISRETGVPYHIMLHDYVPVCPQVNLINESGVYCGEQGLQQCARCVKHRQAAPKMVHPDLDNTETLDVAAWRSSYGQLLAQAAHVSAPSADTADRFRRYFQGLTVNLVPHREDLSHVTRTAASTPRGDVLRIGVIGAIGPHKGSRLLLQCARDARARRLRLKFVVVGYSDIDGELSAAGVQVTGPYEEREVGRQLRDSAVHMVFLPSVWPETFCYTLSVASAAGIPTCTFDLGAQAERLRGNAKALLLPISTASSPSNINTHLIKFWERVSASSNNPKASSPLSRLACCFTDAQTESKPCTTRPVKS